MWKFTAICPIKNQGVPDFPFPVRFTDYGSEIPEVSRSPVPSRTHALNLMSRNVATEWMLLIHPKASLVRLPDLPSKDFEVVKSPGYYGGRLIESSPFYYCLFIKSKSFVILDNSLSESLAFLKFFQDLKGLKTLELEPFWSHAS